MANGGIWRENTYYARARDRLQQVWENLRGNGLWKRMVKNIIATTAAVSISLIPGARDTLGRAAYLAPIATVFGHPGRRFGMLAEALILVLSGTVVGLAWSVLGIYLGSLVVPSNLSAAFAIRGFFLAIALLCHGFLRSHTPRLFFGVLLLIIVAVVSLTSPALQVTAVSVTQILYPILVATGVILLVNVCVFPEFSSAFMASMTIESLTEISDALRDGGAYFIRVSQGHRTVPSTERNEHVPGQEKDGHRHGVGRNAHVNDSPATVEGEVHSEVENRAPPTGLRQRLSFPSFGKSASEPMGQAKHGCSAEEPAEENSLKELTAAKSKVRTKLNNCKAAQRECNFELAFSVLPPQDLKAISSHAMQKVVANTIAVISACESKYALLGDDLDNDNRTAGRCDASGPGEENRHEQDDPDASDSDNNASGFSTPKSQKDVSEKPNERKRTRKPPGEVHQRSDFGQEDLDIVKPKREIEFGDVQLLQYLMGRIARPYHDLQVVLDKSVDVLTICIAYAYDVTQLPSGARVPKGIRIDELDVHIGSLQQALEVFDANSFSALGSAPIKQELEGHVPDIMPREEVFLISSFLLNLRQAASHVEEMLKHARLLVERHQHCHGRRRVHTPRINWRKWLYTGGDEDERIPTTGRQAAREGNADDLDDDQDTANNSQENLLDEPTEEDLEQGTRRTAVAKETVKPPRLSKTKKLGASEPAAETLPFTLRVRGRLADILEWLQTSEDVQYSFKLTVAVFLVTWPAFHPAWNTWYSLNRGLWAALQLVLITEVAIGTSIVTFIVRAAGTSLGCVWGWAAYEARKGNEIVLAAMICIGTIPAVYVQLGSKYPKAGMVAIVSMCVVALSTELNTVPGTGTENFLKRLIAFIIGGVVALIVQVIILPVKARTRLVDSLAACLRQITEMERCFALGIENGNNLDVYSPHIFKHFESASGKAKTALAAAETFLPACSKEPRIKGSFKGLALIYGEIIFVLHQIVDRMDNMLHLRTAYGSGPLEQHNAQIYPYRRNVAAAVTLMLFAVQEAFTTKLALPQFLPSARLANLRLINRVREVTREDVNGLSSHGDGDGTEAARQRAMQLKYISWNAMAAARAEVVEYLEELIDLTKLLVGANEFRSGMLTRPTYLEYIDKIDKQDGVEKPVEKKPVEKKPVEKKPVEKKPVEKKPVEKKPVEKKPVEKAVDTPTESNLMTGLTKRRSIMTKTKSVESEEVPNSLKRIQSKKKEIRAQKRDADGARYPRGAGRLQIVSSL